MKAIITIDQVKHIEKLYHNKLGLKEIIESLRSEIELIYYRVNSKGRKDRFIQSIIKQIIICFYLFKFPNGLTRTRLEEITKLKRTPIYDNLKKLNDGKFLKLSKIITNKKGRPEKIWKFNAI